MPDPLDTQDMAGVIQNSSRQFGVGLEAVGNVQISEGPFESVCVAGMGGSWMAVVLVGDSGLSRVPIRIHRNYGLPPGLESERALVVASSFSGNTEETLSAYRAARDRGLPVVAVSTDGQLAELSQQNFVRIPVDPNSMQPRSATGFMVGILTKLLANHGLATERAVEEVASLEGSLEGFMGTARQHAERLVPGLRQATPVIYASDRYATVARIFKIKINENGKTPAFWNVLPELNHNEMVGWTQRQGPFHIVFLLDKEEDERIQRRTDLTRELLSEHGISSAVVPMVGASVLEKAFHTLLIADWASYKLALALGVDPTPVDMVEDFKGRLANNP